MVDPRLKQGVGTKFADIAGMKEAKQEVMEFVDYLRKSDHYRRLGAKVHNFFLSLYHFKADTFNGSMNFLMLGQLHGKFVIPKFLV